MKEEFSKYDKVVYEGELFEVLETADNTGMMIYIILAVLINSSCIFFSTVVWALVADSVDYQELQTGK